MHNTLFLFRSTIRCPDGNYKVQAGHSHCAGGGWEALDREIRGIHDDGDEVRVGSGV